MPLVHILTERILIWIACQDSLEERAHASITSNKPETELNSHTDRMIVFYNYLIAHDYDRYFNVFHPLLTKNENIINDFKFINERIIEQRNINVFGDVHGSISECAVTSTLYHLSPLISKNCTSHIHLWIIQTGLQE